MPYLALLAAGFRLQLRARFAAVNGIATNIVFGLVRSAVFFALYRHAGPVSGLDRAQALTYVWVVEALFSVTYVPWQWEFARRIRSGDVAVELTRPTHPWLSAAATDLGRNLAQLATRSVVPFAVAALVAHLALPTSPAGWSALVAAFLLAAALSFEVRFLQELSAFLTPDYRGIGRLVIFPMYFLAGFAIPVEFFPPALRAVAILSPVYGLLAGPVHVAQDIDVAASLALGLGWVLALGLLTRTLLARGLRGLVVAGG
ncbi:MAG: ABC transporter permease [Mycobacteriales bacterium]